MIERGPLPQRGFLVVQNEVVRDEALSFKARGILVFLLSQPPGYSTSAERIADQGPDGRSAVLSGLKELEDRGYLVRRRERLDNGRFIHKDVVYDSPVVGKPEAENRTVVRPAETHESAGQTEGGLSDDGKPADKDLVPRDEELEREELEPVSLTLIAAPDPLDAFGFDDFWAAYPNKRGKPTAVKAFAKAIKRAKPAVIVAAALAYREDPNRDDAYTKHPATWLNNDCWNDPPLPPRRSAPSSGRSAQAIANVVRMANGSDQRALPR